MLDCLLPRVLAIVGVGTFLEPGKESCGGNAGNPARMCSMIEGGNDGTAPGSDRQMFSPAFGRSTALS